MKILTWSRSRFCWRTQAVRYHLKDETGRAHAHVVRYCRKDSFIKGWTAYCWQCDETIRKGTKRPYLSLIKQHVEACLALGR